MIIGVPKEIKLQEHRIGLTPESVKVLTNKGHEVLVQHDGGYEAGFSNEDYKNAGAKIEKKASEIFKNSELIVKVKAEIVAYGISTNDYNIDKTGIHLNATKFNAMIDKPNTVVVDMRNHYESEVGKFENAICPDVDTSKDY